MNTIEAKIRKIIHIDMDAFFASVEQRDFPQYRGKPLAVGGSRQRGVVAAASYEARKYGVHSAMSSTIAFKKCPEIIFVKARFEVYKEVSRQIMDIFQNYTDVIEPLSLDEAYLDVTENKVNMTSATLIARDIKKTIKTQTGLTASAGVSFNKFLAKVASDIKKPDGLTVITPDQAEEFLLQLPIKKFHGVGKVTERKMNDLGIFNGEDLLKLTEEELTDYFGKMGTYFYNVVRANDTREVTPDRIRKSISAETTFDKDVKTEEEIIFHLKDIISILFQRLNKAKKFGKTITLKVRYHDFVLQTFSKTSFDYIYLESEIFRISRDLINTINYSEKPIRLLGVGVSNLSSDEDANKPVQLSFNFF